MEETAIKIVKILNKHGHKAYFAGGCVRDRIMNNPVNDYDIATSAVPDEIRKIFKRTIPVGIKFGVVIVLLNGYQFEVATFRKDGEYYDGRHPSTVTFSDEREDVLRRDFTINGLLYNPLSDEIIDYVDGQKDIQEGVIRTIGNPYERFSEDKLRMLRAIRFSIRFNYVIEEKSFNAIILLHSKLIEVSKERIKDELFKIFSEPNVPDAIELLIKTNLLKTVLPSANVLAKEEMYRKCLIDNLYKIKDELPTQSPEFVFAVLLYQLFLLEQDVFDLTEKQLLEKIYLFCKELRFSTKEIRYITYLVKGILLFPLPESKLLHNTKKIVREQKFNDLLHFYYVDCLIHESDMLHYNFFKDIHAKLMELPKEKLFPKPLLNGSELQGLGIKPSPQMKVILNELEDQQLMDKVVTKEQAINFVKDNYL